MSQRPIVWTITALILWACVDAVLRDGWAGLWRAAAMLALYALSYAPLYFHLQRQRAYQDYMRRKRRLFDGRPFDDRPES